MPDHLRTALLLEEKAAKLPRGSERRALLAMATRARRLAIGLAPTDYGNSIGSLHKQVEVWVATVGKMPDGPAKDKLRLRAERAAVQGALAGLLRIPVSACRPLYDGLTLFAIDPRSAECASCRRCEYLPAHKQTIS